MRKKVWQGINSLGGHLRGTADLGHAQYLHELQVTAGSFLGAHLKGIETSLDMYKLSVN